MQLCARGPDATSFRAQIQAVYDLGLEDWILWDPASSYSSLASALEPETRPRASLYDAPAALERRMDRYEEWRMRESRQRALQR